MISPVNSEMNPCSSPLAAHCALPLQADVLPRVPQEGDGGLPVNTTTEKICRGG